MSGENICFTFYFSAELFDSGEPNLEIKISIKFKINQNFILNP